jgi:hypothetical protein
MSEMNEVGEMGEIELPSCTSVSETYHEEDYEPNNIDPFHGQETDLTETKYEKEINNETCETSSTMETIETIETHFYQKSLKGCRVVRLVYLFIQLAFPYAIQLSTLIRIKLCMERFAETYVDNDYNQISNLISLFGINIIFFFCFLFFDVIQLIPSCAKKKYIDGFHIVDILLSILYVYIQVQTPHWVPLNQTDTFRVPGVCVRQCLRDVLEINHVWNGLIVNSVLVGVFGLCYLILGVVIVLIRNQNCFLFFYINRKKSADKRKKNTLCF